MTAPRVPTFATVALVLFAAPSGAQAFAAPSFARPTWTSAQSFTTVTGVRELSSGSVLVADFSEPMVHLLAPGGQSAKQIGRKGSGPREYLTPLRLIALPNDSTLLIDRDADRYLIIAPNGDIVATTPFPEQMRLAGQYIRGADQGGRLYFQMRYIAPEPTAPSTTGILRWDRRSVRFDSLGFVKMPSATPIGGKLANGASYQGMRIMPYTPADAWTVAPDGRIAMIRVAPYRVDWLATGRPPVVGGAIPYSPVPVTDADRKANEPKGPPFTLVYAEVKPPFSNDAVVLDDRARLWIGRSFTRGAKTRDWDVVDSQGKLLKTINLAADKWIMAVTARFVYVLWRDQDDVEWLQAYAR
ncbi:MAG: hypothetical protein KA745_06780 [Gemmatimonadales bacterium]|nr:hypothetical protein [Gemmatimonadota bacterium]MBP7620651.1 hypothetical protein [Gemmatimonadales bacterium]